MRTPRFPPALRAAFAALVIAGLGGGLVRAAQTTKFTQKQDELRKQWEADRQRLGLSHDQQALYAKYPTPEIGLCTAVPIAPGASASISIPGKFPAGTTFVSKEDAAELTNAAIAAGTYKATLAVAPGVMPGFVEVYAYAPVSGAVSSCSAAIVGPVLSFDLHAANGWTVKVTPTAKAFTLSEDAATLAYRVEFMRPNETKAFETRTSELHIGRGTGVGESLTFELQEAPGSAQAELMDLSKKMSDPQAFSKLSEAERDAMTDRLGKLTQQMLAEMMASMANPAAAEQKQDDFGCSSLDVTETQPGRVTGSLSCGKNVGSPDLTGTFRVGP